MQLVATFDGLSMSLSIYLQVMPPTWENPGELCVKYSCEDGAVVMVNESLTCTCQPVRGRYVNCGLHLNIIILVYTSFM